MTDIAITPTSKPPKARSPRNRGVAVRTLFAAVVSLGFLLPVVWVAAAAFTPSNLIFANLSSPSLKMLVPQSPTLANFGRLTEFNFWHYLGNSLIVTGVSIAVGLVIVVFAGFALAVFRFRGRGVWFAVVVVSFMIPFDAIAIPLAMSFRDWGLGNTYLALILPGLAHGMAVFNLRQFFLNVPRSLLEAAAVDGAGPIRVLWQIYIPLSKPAVISSAVLLYLGQWVAYLWPLLIANADSVAVAPIALARVFGEFQVDYGRLFAGSLVLGVIPGLILLFMQRYFVQSVSSVAEK